MKHPKYFETDPSTSKRMASVKLKRGEEEVLLAKTLWRKGYRYRYNYKKLPGSPDIVIPKYKIAIFVDGEFWHGKDWNIKKNQLKRNKDYWIKKIEENIARDKRVTAELKSLGWMPLRFWSKQVKTSVEDCSSIIDSFVKKL